MEEVCFHIIMNNSYFFCAAPVSDFMLRKKYFSQKTMCFITFLRVKYKCPPHSHYEPLSMSCIFIALGKDEENGAGSVINNM